jgi:hypothetical protein
VIDVSDSQIKAYKKCPRYWVYTKLLKLDDGEDKWNLDFGGAVHTGLEHLHLGDTLQNALAKAGGEVASSPWRDEKMERMVPAMVQGYAQHALPRWQQQWRLPHGDRPAVEQWYSYHPDPEVHVRGSRDLVAVRRDDAQFVRVTDHKTTGSSGGGDLAKNIARNVQLALYAVSFAREFGQWPNEVALSFLQKPRRGDLDTICRELLASPDWYFVRERTVDHDFACFAMAVEHEVVAYGRQMAAIKTLVERDGPAACEHVPADLDACFAYNRWCGFSQGCHACDPAHRRLVHA